MFSTKCKCSIASSSSSTQKNPHQEVSFTWQKRNTNEGRQTRAPHWAQKHNVVKFMNRLESQLQIQSPQDWYKVTHSQIIEKGGGSLLKRFGTFRNLLQFTYPDINWDSSKFSHQRGYWTRENIKKYVESVKPKLNIQNHEDWYKIGVEQFLSVGGQGFMRKYKSSLYNLLKDIYPEHDWQPWRFISAPRNFWKSKAAVAKYIKWLENELGIKSLRDWATVSAQDIERHYGGSSFLRTYGGLQGFLREFYPDHDWNAYEQTKESTTSKAQYRLTHILKRIFPDVELLSNYRHDQMKNQEFDIFIPKFNLAFEYQGEHHYNYHFIYNYDNIVQQRDAKKITKAKQLNIDLIHVPYWWDRSEQSLRATIHSVRPDLNIPVEATCKPIPTSPPKSSRAITKALPFVHLMEPSCDHSYSVQHVMESRRDFPDIQEWLVYQMVDGQAVYWNCEARKFYDKYGNIITADSEVVAIMPDIPLEGILLNQSKQFMATDMPNSTTIYRDRYHMLQEIFPEGSSKHVQVIPVEVCQGIQHIKEYLQRIPNEALVVLKNPMSHYHPGKSAFDIITISATDEELARVEKVIKEGNQQIALCTRYVHLVISLTCRPDKSEVKVTIPNDQSVSQHEVVRIAINKSSGQPAFLSIMNHISWESYLRTLYPYALAVGKAAAKCRGCNKVLPREELRVTTHQAHYYSSEPMRLFNPPTSHPQYAFKHLPAHFCLSSTCIRTAIAQYHSPTVSKLANTTQQPRQKMKDILYPSFSGIVHLPHEIRSTMNEDQLQKLAADGEFKWLK